jgi:hypothetical protein
MPQKTVRGFTGVPGKRCELTKAIRLDSAEALNSTEKKHRVFEI